jgi:triacylglycerol lipase
MTPKQQRDRVRMAELLLGCCEAVYLHPDGPGWSGFLSAHNLSARLIENKNARAAVFADEKRIIAAIAGTNDVDDWKNNLSIRKHKYLGEGKVSSGFGAYFGLIRRDLVAVISDEFNKAARPVYICGHSLGGAACYLLAQALSHDGIPWELGVVAGAPRPGDKAFARFFDLCFEERWIQLRNRADLVPCVPPWSLGYRHPAVGLAVITGGAIKRDLSAAGQQVRRVFRVAGAHVGIGGFRIGRAVSVEDHSVSEYRAAVAASLDSLAPGATEWAGERG